MYLLMSLEDGEDVLRNSTQDSPSNEILSNADGSGALMEDSVEAHMASATISVVPQSEVCLFCQGGVDRSSSLSPCNTDSDDEIQIGLGSGSIDLEGSPQAFAQGSSIFEIKYEEALLSCYRWCINSCGYHWNSGSTCVSRKLCDPTLVT